MTRKKGYFKPEDIHLSGAFVNAIVQTNWPKKIERVTTTPREKQEDKMDFKNMDERQKKRFRIIKRAAQELNAGILTMNFLIQSMPHFIVPFAKKIYSLFFCIWLMVMVSLFYIYFCIDI